MSAATADLVPGAAPLGDAPDRSYRPEMSRRLSGRLVVVMAGAALTAVTALPAPAVAAQGDVVPGELLVRFEADATAEERTEARRDVDATLENRLPVPDVQLLEVASGASVDAAAEELERRPDVLFAEPNRIRTADPVPNDPSFGRLWGFHNTGQIFSPDAPAGTSDADVDAVEAWDATTGSPDVTVAVVDSGIHTDHPDLNDNGWTNRDESGSGRESNGVDDDGNGLVDDHRGWDFSASTSTSQGDADPSDVDGHGTHVAGTIGAEGGNGFGVTGMSWDVSLMPVRVLDDSGSGTDADIASGFFYAAREGAQVVNASLGGPGESQTLRAAIDASPNTLFVFAAGNDGTDNDAISQDPCNAPGANVICVAATDPADALASFSNYGAASVDLGAPGVEIASSYPGGGYAYLSGSSMAAPQVAGVAGLLLARDPGASVARVREAVLDGTESRPSLAGRTTTGGRLNAARALGQTAPASVPVPASEPAPSQSSSGGEPSGGGESSGEVPSGGDESLIPSGLPAPPSPTPVVAASAGMRESALARTVTRCRSTYSGRRETNCVRRARALSRCTALRGSRRTTCVRRARAIRY